MDYKDYISSDLLALIPVLYLCGAGLKRSKLPDKWIPLILGALGVALAATWALSTKDVFSYQDVFSTLFTSVTQGILVAGASVYINQLFEQANKKE